MTKSVTIPVCSDETIVKFAIIRPLYLLLSLSLFLAISLPIKLGENSARTALTNIPSKTVNEAEFS